MSAATPQHIMQLGLGFWASKTVLSAVELGVFSTLAGHDAEEAMRKKVEAARKSNAALAERIRLEGPKLAAALKALARDVALSLIETAALNQQIPPGVPPLRDPDSLARSIPAVPRENISEKLIEMWVRTSDGGLIGNQTDVVSEDGKIGHIQINRSLRVDCVRRKYRSIEYHPEDFPFHAEPFHTLMRLPDFGSPGVGFDGSVLIEQAVVAIDPNAPEPERKRSNRFVQTELVPLGTWPAPEPSAADDTFAETSNR